MDKTSSAICFAFLQKAPPAQQQALWKHASKEWTEQLHHYEKWTSDPTFELPSNEEELDHVHASWLTPFLRALPEGDIKLVLGSLTEAQQRFLQETLLFSNHIPTLSSLGKRFLRETLFSYLAKQEELLPPTCLPFSPLNALLALDYEELLSLISLLAMHDLAIEVRQIIDKTKLKQIDTILSSAQVNFLKTLLHRKEPVSFKKMSLNKWDGDAETLQSILQQRGINRLAKALYPHESSLQWYVSRRLDHERGMLLSQLCTPLDHPRAAALLSDEVTTLIDAIQNEEE